MSDSQPTKIVNLCPHPFVLYDGAGEKVLLTIPASGQQARVAENLVRVGEIAGIPTHKIEYGETVGLPPPEAGTVYIVSSFVAAAVPDRCDVAVPATGPTMAVRNAAGGIIGTKGGLVLNRAENAAANLEI